MKKEMTNDMTVGSPAKLIIQFMIPMCLGNVFQQFYNIADSIIAGQFLGVNALAAIGSTGSLMFFVTGWLQGLTSGFAILVSQWFGAKDMKRMRHYVAMSIYLTIAFAVVMTIGFEFANEPILRLMNSPENLMADIKGYMAVIYGGLIVTAAYNALAAVLRALGDSKSPLYFLIISAIINVVLDIVFIVNFGMGVEGCGYATVIAQAVSALLCLIYIVKKFPILRLSEEDFRISFQSMGRLLALGIPMGLQFSITAIGTIIVQGAVNIYGAVYMAGFSAAGKLQNIIVTVFTAFGATVATYVGQNRGAGKMDRVHGSTIHADHGICLECGHNGFGVLLWRRDDIVVCEQNGDRGTSCSGSLFPDGVLGIPVFRKYFYLSKCAAGNGLRSCSDAWWCV